MSLALDQAIFTRLAAENIAATITGGVWAGRIPPAGPAGERIELPYAVYSEVSVSPAINTGSAAYTSHERQFAIYDRTKADVQNHLATLQAALEASPWTLPDEQDELVEIRISDIAVSLDATGTWQGVLSVRFLVRAAVSP